MMGIILWGSSCLTNIYTSCAQLLKCNLSWLICFIKQPPAPTLLLPPSHSLHSYISPVFPHWAQFLCLPPSPTSPYSPFRLIFLPSYCSRGACICHGACWSRDISSTRLLLLPCLSPLSDLCSPIALFEFACGTAGSPPSLDTVSDSEDTSVSLAGCMSAEALQMWVFAVI